MMDPFKCPSCGSLAVNVEFSGVLVQDKDGNEMPDEVSCDVSADSYADCRDCGHGGIAEEFGA